MQPRERFWEQNSKVVSCRKCRVTFNLAQRKHHCRSCGKIFCSGCSSFYMRLPTSALCPNRPVSVTQDMPVRCCCECAQRVRIQVANENLQIVHQCQMIRDTLGVRTTDTLELQPQHPTKLYIVELPKSMNIQENEVVSMVLNGRTHHVIVPHGLQPGDIFYVRANDGFVGPLHPHHSSGDHRTVSEDTVTVIDRLPERFYESTLAPTAPPLPLAEPSAPPLDTSALPMAYLLLTVNPEETEAVTVVEAQYLPCM